MKTSIILTTKSHDGKKAQHAISDVNPRVSEDVAKTFAQMISALSTESYQNSERLDTTALKANSELIAPEITMLADLNGDAVDKRTATAQNILDAVNSERGAAIAIQTDTPAKPFVKSLPDDVAVAFDTDDKTLPYGYTMSLGVKNSGVKGQIVIGFPPTETFAAADFIFTIGGE